MATEKGKGIIGRIRTALCSHDYSFDRSVDWQPDGYTRHHRGGDEEDIPSCTIIDKCVKCGLERRVGAPADLAEQYDIPLEWDE